MMRSLSSLRPIQLLSSSKNDFAGGWVEGTSYILTEKSFKQTRDSHLLCHFRVKHCS
jgi:hypothetical protein